MKAKEVRYTNQWSGKQEPYVENAWDSAAGFGDSARGFKKREKTVTQHSLQSLSSLATQRTDAKSLRERKRTLQLDESRLVELTQHFASSKLESYAVLILGTTGMVPASVAAEDALFKVQQYDKRSGAEFAAKEGGNGTYTSLPLFERYQFFTPGLFMGLGVTLLLLAILSVGIRAISSLQVSYAAFEKEGGPGKKTQ